MIVCEAKMIICSTARRNSKRLSPPKYFEVLLGRAQPVIPPNLYVNKHNSLGSPGNMKLYKVILSYQLSVNYVLSETSMCTVFEKGPYEKYMFSANIYVPKNICF